MNITLKDGSVRQYEPGTPAIDVIRDISQGLARATLAVQIDGQTMDANTPIMHDCTLNALTFADPQGRETLRHTASHIMASAVLTLFPGTKLAIGPAIENGFYYDFDSEHVFTAADFEAIEKQMAAIVKADLAMERFTLPREQAIALMRERGESYKVELIEDLPEDETISFYRTQEFVDLCAGPHLAATGAVKAFKLLSVAGAYWRGSEKNKMLQRIYATAFDKKKELDEHLAMLEEAKKRDHRKLGRELELFNIMDEGPGFAFFLPNGMILRNELEEYWRTLHRKAGYHQISTPLILSRDLWYRSGHWDHYKDNMYGVKIDDEDYAIKPMNCPGGMLVYKNSVHSYRDLPLRMGEMGLVHRHELSGALHGLMRVRCFTQDDAHIFMTPDQIEQEIFSVIDMAVRLYDTFGFTYHLELSTRPEDSMGTDEQWDAATAALHSALQKKQLPYVVNEGDGAFYGPKIDFQLRDSLGRTWQCGTIQLDMQMPERFDLTYVGPDGAKHRPVMIHRVIYGSIERFIGILIEHFAGAFPLWMSPLQVKVLTITSRADDFAHQVVRTLEDAGIRARADLRNEKIGFKIREAQAEKTPYMLVLGDKEVQAGAVAVRKRGQGDVGVQSLADFTNQVAAEIVQKTIF